MCESTTRITPIIETIKENRQREVKNNYTGIVHVLPLNVCTKDLMTPKRLVGGDGGEARLIVCSFAGYPILINLFAVLTSRFPRTMLESGGVETRYNAGDSGSVTVPPSKELMRLRDSSGGASVRDVTGWLKSDFVEETGMTVYAGMVSALLVSCKGG